MRVTPGLSKAFCLGAGCRDAAEGFQLNGRGESTGERDCKFFYAEQPIGHGLEGMLKGGKAVLVSAQWGE